MIRLEAITPENWRLGLEVSEAQRGYVSDGMRLLARAYAFRESGSAAFVICAGDVPVGMALYYGCEELNAYDFSQLFIDERYQGRGYGLAAAEEILLRMKDDGRYNSAALCYIEGNEPARRMYEKIGFRPTGERDGDEIVMRYDWGEADIPSPSTRRAQQMTVNEYQKLAMRTLNPALEKKDVLINGVMGLCGESGEAIDIVKKHLAQGHELNKEHLAKELGDVAWYLAETATAIGYSLEDILQMNIDKLKARYPEGFDTDGSLHRRPEDI